MPPPTIRTLTDIKAFEFPRPLRAGDSKVYHIVHSRAFASWGEMYCIADCKRVLSHNTSQYLSSRDDIKYYRKCARCDPDGAKAHAWFDWRMTEEGKQQTQEVQTIKENAMGKQSMAKYRADLARARAKKTFRFYMTLLFEKAGKTYDSDNLAEWDGIVDDVIEAAVETMEARR